MSRRSKVMGFALGVSAVLLTAQASAQAVGFELGGRIGYGIPLGRVTGDTNDELSSTISGTVPIQADVGVRVLPQLMLGAYFQYGFGFVGDTTSDVCDEIGADCSTRDVRLGVQGQVHFSPGETTDPWLGLGVGYEWLTIALEASTLSESATVKATAHGLEFLQLQGGLDFQAGEHGGFGPFLSLSLAQFSRVSASCSGDCEGIDPDSESIEDQATHQWLMLGLRGTFVL